MKKGVYFSVGICAFNEGRNVRRLIEAIQLQKLPEKFKLKEIIVVASGCTDDTVEIVKKNQKKDKRISLITQSSREGKAAAVNIFLKNAKTKLLFLQSADTLPDKYCYKLLLEELVKPSVGLVAGKIIPKDDQNTFLGFANRLKWTLHHEINLAYPQRPKVGELIAFKKTFERIPPKTAVDEASIEPLIHLQGFQIKYVPDALVFNQGPKKLREYLSGRRRVYAGHLVTKKKYAYEIITFNSLRIIPIFLRNLQLSPKYLVYAFATGGLEIIARLVGYFDVRFKLRDHSIWKVATSSKEVVP